MKPDACIYHPERPADARFSGACSWQCEARKAREDRAARPRLDRALCDCGGELHTRLDRGMVVKRCLKCRATEQLSPLVVQHLCA